MILLVVIGMILMWACPNEVNGFSLDIAGQILFWIGVITTILGFFYFGSIVSLVRRR